MAKDKFVPIDPSILNDDDSSSATPSAQPVTQPTAPQPVKPDEDTLQAAHTSPVSRTPEQQAGVADFVARQQEGEARQNLVKAAQAIKAKYPESGDRQPEPGSDEEKILKAYEQEYGQGNLDAATAKAQAENIPTALKPIVAAGEGVADAVDKTGFALGVGSGEYKPVVPGGTTGQVTKSVTQFVTGMAATLSTLSGQGIGSGAGKLADAGRVAFAGGVSGAITQDPHEENLSNLIEQHSSLLAPIASYMAARPDDTEAVARTKKFFENAGLGLATDGLMGALKYLKLSRAAKAGDKAAAAAAPQAADELAQTLKSGGSDYLDQAKAKGIELPQPKPLLPEPPKAFVSPEDAEKLRASVDNTVTQDGTHFNFDHLPDNYDAKSMINEVSKVVSDKVEAVTGGVQSLKETADLADILGQKPAELMASLAKDASGAQEQAARVVAGKSLMVDLAQQITDQSRLINAAASNGADTAAAEAKLLKLMNVHADLQVNLKGAITGAARTTGAGRIDVKEAAKLFSMADGNPAAIAKLVRPLTTGEKVFGTIHEFRVNAMLSGVKTLVIKSTSDLLNGIALPTARIVGGVAHGDLAAIKDGVGTAVGLFKSLGDSFSMARKALNDGAPVLDAPSELSAQPRHFVASNGSGFVPSMINALGSVVRFPSRLIGTIDEFSKQMSYRGAIYSQASREGAAKGLTGDALSQYITDSTSRSFDGTGRATNDAALQYAKEATFTGDLDYGIGKWLQDGANKLPVVRAVVPFIKVPTNLARNAAQYTPGIQFLDRGFREDLAAGGVRAAQARGKQMIGASMYALATYLATSGRITGSGPQNPEARQALQATGWQPYSFKVGDRYVSFSRLDPYGMPFGLVADAADTFGRVDGQTADKIAGAMVHSLAHNITSKTYLGGMVEMLDALANPDQRVAEKAVQSFLGSFVPNTRQFTDLRPETQDPYMRETRSLLDGVRNKIPGLSQTLAPVRNLFGEPVNVPQGMGVSTMSPFNTSKGVPDDLAKELSKFPKGFSLPSTKIGNVDLTQIPSKAGGYDAYDRLLQLNGSTKVNGKTLKDKLSETIKSDEYQNKLTDDGPGYAGSKYEKLGEIVSGYRDAAQKALQKENPNVFEAMKADRNARKNALTTQPTPANPLNSLTKALGINQQ